MDQETAGKVILVVDDESQRLARTQRILAEAGYGVLSAGSAEEAKALADTDAEFDLIICPVVMEGRGENGVRLAEHIERTKRTASTLLFSHYSRDLLTYIPGFDRQRHFLSNPFGAEELLRRVRDLLAGVTGEVSNLTALSRRRRTGVRKGGLGYDHRQPTSPTTVYKVTIQATPVGTGYWKVMASGTWTPGQQPQLEQTLSAEVVEALFSVSPSANSGRNQVELGNTSYAMVFRRISK